MSHPDNTLHPKLPRPPEYKDYINPTSIHAEISECKPDKLIIKQLLAEYNAHQTPSETGVEVFIEVRVLISLYKKVEPLIGVYTMTKAEPSDCLLNFKKLSYK